MANTHFFEPQFIVDFVPASTVSKDRQFIADYLNQSSIFALYKNEQKGAFLRLIFN